MITFPLAGNRAGAETRHLCSRYFGTLIFYQILRDTHLFFGLSRCLFLRMYGIGSVQMAPAHLFSLEPAVATMQLTLPAGSGDARWRVNRLTLLVLIRAAGWVIFRAA